MKRKKYDPQKSLRRAMVGIKITWDDETPEMYSDHIVDPVVSHRNPIYNHKARALWASVAGRKMVTQWAAHWRINITVVFSYPNRVDQEHRRELEAYCVLDNLNSVALDLITEMRRYGAESAYKTTRFVVECLGLNPPTEMHADDEFESVETMQIVV